MRTFFNFQKGTVTYYLLLAIVIILAVVSTSLVAVQIVNPRLVVVAVGLFVGLVFLFGLVRKPEFGLPILVFLTYTRAPDVIPGIRELPSLSSVLAIILLIIVIFRRIYFYEQIAYWHRPVVFLGSFGLIVLASLLYAKDQESIRSALNDLVFDISIVLAVTVLLRSTRDLRMVVWALIASGILLGTLSTLQQITGSYHNSFFGLSQVEILNIVGSVDDYRVNGPGLDPNSYGMYMVLIIPLAIDRIWNEHNLPLRLAALWSFLVVSLTVMFTFSRGAFLTLVFVLILFFIQHPPKIRTVIYLTAIGAALFFLSPARYMERLGTLFSFFQDSGETGNTSGLDISQSALSEPSFKGRFSENLVGIKLASDYPILGVGYLNFGDYYQSYSRTLGIDSRREQREVPNLYLQFAAEMGIVGLIWLGTLQFVTFIGLRRAKDRFLLSNLDQEASLVSALLITLAGFLFASIFRHLIYPRYVWLLFGILLAIPYLSKVELEKFRNRIINHNGKG